MIFSVNFQEIYHVISIIMNFDHKKVFLFTNFRYHLILHFQMIMHWYEFCEENEMIDISRHFLIKIPLIFHYHSHNFLPTNKRVRSLFYKRSLQTFSSCFSNKLPDC